MMRVKKCLCIIWKQASISFLSKPNHLFTLKNLLLKGNALIAANILLSIYYTPAQVFSPLGQGLNDNVRALCADTINNLIYAGGNFMASGTLPLSRIAVWNGVTWDSLVSGTDANVLGLVMYQGNLIAGGPFYQMGGLSAKGVASWNGFQWQNIGNLSSGLYGGVYGLKIIDNEIYALGTFDSLNGIPSSKIAKWDGNSWYSFPVLDNYNGGFSIRTAAKYNGDLYVGGNFDSQLAPNMKDIAKWNGSTWSPVLNGFTGAFTEVTALAVFQGDLYVGGNFFTSSGDPGNCILKWNGTSWSQLGMGLNNFVIDMIVFQNELIVCGAFTMAGSLPVSHIAKWDGNQWHAIPNADIDIAGVSMTQLNNELYIGGVFYDINGQVVNNIVKYNPTVGFSHLNSQEFSVYPSLTTDFLNIELKKISLTTISIFDYTGRLVYQALINGIKNRIDISEMTTGIYILTLRSDKINYSRKIIKYN